MKSFREFINEDTLDENNAENHFSVSSIDNEDLTFQDVFTKSAKEIHNELKKLLGGTSVPVHSLIDSIDYLNKCKQKDIHDSFTKYETVLYLKSNYLSIRFGGDMLIVHWSLK